MLKQVLEIKDFDVEMIIEQQNEDTVELEVHDNGCNQSIIFELDKHQIRIFIGVLLKYQSDLNKNV